MTASPIDHENKMDQEERSILSGGNSLPKARLLFPATVLTAFLLIGLGIYLVFYIAPTEAVMGLVQKIFYIHVPAAWVMFLALLIGAGASVAFIATRRDGADRLAHSSLELATLFGLMVLITGPLWGYKTWGTPWEWDVRLTTFLVLELVLLAYLLVRAFGGPGARLLAAAIAIFGTVQLPIVYFSVDLWRGQHPTRVVSEGGLHPDMLLALIVCLAGFLLVFLVFLTARLAIGRAEARLDELYLLAEDSGLEET